MLSPIQLTPTMDMGTLVNAINNNFRQIEGESRVKIIRDEDGTNRILIGRRPDGEYVIQVSKPGIDVLEASPDDMVFNSNNNLFKIVESGEIPISVATTANGTSSAIFSHSVNHDQNYSPMVIAFITYPSPQQPGLTTTRLFGAGGVSARSVSTSGVTIGSASEESITTSGPIGPNKGTVMVTYRRHNGSGFALPAFTGKIKYYLLTETA